MATAQCVRVLFDTNFLNVPEKFHIDVEKELTELVGKHEKITLTPVIREMKKLGIRNFIGVMREYETKEYDADQAIINYAINNRDVVVCTNDSELRASLKEKRVPVVYVRGRKKLGLDGYVKKRGGRIEHV